MSVEGARWQLLGPELVQLERFSVPPPGPGEVLVRTCWSALSIASELSTFLAPERVPTPLGYQSVGEVLASGPGVALAAGQRVVGLYGHASHAV